MPKKPTDSAKNVRGDSDTFISFMRRLVQVPHSEIKAELDAERAIKQRSKSKPFTRMADLSSRVPDGPSRGR
jgi:hypothetical protein